MNVKAQALDPADIPGIAVDSMNATHQEEVVMVNELAAMLQKLQAGEADETDIDQQLQQWLEHTEQHFSRENRLMQEYAFPPYPVHAQEHAAALELLRQIIGNWRQQRNLEALTQDVFQDWPQWFNRHVSSMDYVTAQFLSGYID